MITAKKIGSAVYVEQVFKQNRNRRRKRQFGYESTDKGTLAAEQAFRTGYFLGIIDQAITSMNTVFEQLQQSDTRCGCLYNINTMRQLNDDDFVRTAIQYLQYLWTIRDSFPNTAIAYRILLTVSVTVASAERSFFKLKLIKNSLRSTMSQDRFCGLAILSIEKDIVSTLDYKDLIH
jgi:hypothetical protein